MEWIWYGAVKNMNRKYNIDKATTPTPNTSNNNNKRVCLTTHKCVQTNKLKWKWKQREEQKKRTWANWKCQQCECEFEYIFNEMANFGMKFKSKCHGGGGCVKERAKAKNRKKNFLAKTKPKFHYRFRFLSIRYSLGFSIHFVFFSCDKAGHTYILNHHYRALNWGISPFTSFPICELPWVYDDGCSGGGGWIWNRLKQLKWNILFLNGFSFYCEIHFSRFLGGERVDVDNSDVLVASQVCKNILLFRHFAEKPKFKFYSALMTYKAAITIFKHPSTSNSAR